MSTAKDPERFQHIDAMRAIAVILVIWTHYAERFVELAGSQQALDALQRSVNFGRIGVVIFFAISGMLIPTSLHGDLGPGTKRFVIRRFFRLYPAYWLALPAGYFVHWVLFDKTMDPHGMLANVTMIPAAFGASLILPHGWTLETELYFYVVCLLLFWCGWLHRMLHLCVVTVALCALFASTVALHVFPAEMLSQYKTMPYHLGIMFWGACFRQAYDAPSKLLRLRLAASGPLSRLSMTYRAALAYVTIAVVGVALAGAIDDWRHHNAFHLPISLAYMIGIAAFAMLATVLKLRNRPLAWIGKISYSVYLLHSLPLFAAFWLCQRFHLVGWPLGVYMIVPLLPLIPLSWAGYLLCEAPFVKLAHALTSRRASGVLATGEANG
ncbi:TPA: acyltransferase [Burkholderia vietnamiensis]|uniref:acyltransferase family protein n=1 Tax=Burkholderia vietnamiensis TaxID=60552 RepID=UPI000756A002|nr:acyltransferase [Burkholderia vietnamiensis]KVE68074.1 acyltransferase [Burkholderia vietnamiensis]MCA7943800.1 acyltransferase [Burkholderia vietnamiensis]MDN7815303.1 acyltransferase [Burkholderia vietnamiensis]HDR8972177.1 acyltransferase [Burkholderia vietnamiensis]HDR9141675.1 acyltransferase [Burkholderia vietnamiensis]